jgi:hypothetical protein
MKAERERDSARSGKEHLKDKGERKDKGKKKDEEGGRAAMVEEEDDVPEEDFDIDPCDDLFSLTSPRCLTVEEVRKGRKSTLRRPRH